MNEFIEWVRLNARAVALGAAGLLLLSALIGLLVGLSARKAGLREGTPVVERVSTSGKGASARSGAKSADQRAAAKRGKASDPLSDLPRPVVLEYENDLASYSFALDRAAAELESVQPLPVRTSELIRYRDVDLEADAEPFVFDNEEFDVLIESYEPSEP